MFLRHGQPWWRPCRQKAPQGAFFILASTLLTQLSFNQPHHGPDIAHRRGDHSRFPDCGHRLRLRPTAPEQVLAGLKLLGDAALPMMLFALGVRLTSLTRAGLGLGLVGALARPLLGLLIGLPLAWALGLEGAARGQLLLFAALPPAVMQFMLAERYHQEPDKVGAMIMLGNALAVLFVPLALALGL